MEYSGKCPDPRESRTDCDIELNYLCQSAFRTLPTSVCYLVFHKDFALHFLASLPANPPGEIFISYRGSNLKKGVLGGIRLICQTHDSMSQEAA